MPPQQFSELILEGDLSMVLFLVVDVTPLRRAGVDSNRCRFLVLKTM
jgi:hypothetical protein